MITTTIPTLSIAALVDCRDGTVLGSSAGWLCLTSGFGAMALPLLNL
jgi:hypothetical protein